MSFESHPYPAEILFDNFSTVEKDPKEDEYRRLHMYAQMLDGQKNDRLFSMTPKHKEKTERKYWDVRHKLGIEEVRGTEEHDKLMMQIENEYGLHPYFTHKLNPPENGEDVGLREGEFAFVDNTTH